MIIRNLELSDASQIAILHRRAFNTFFLSSLGQNFLINFYTAIIKSKQSIKLGIFVDKRLIGFAVGARKRKGFYLYILKNNFISLGSSAFISLLLNPLRIYKLLISLTSSIQIEDFLNENAILLSICVDPSVSKSGNGSLLLSKFEKIAFEFSDLISLTTDVEDNELVNLFYIKNKYIIYNSYNQGKRKMNTYIKHK